LRNDVLVGLQEKIYTCLHVISPCLSVYAHSKIHEIIKTTRKEPARDPSHNLDHTSSFWSLWRGALSSAEAVGFNAAPKALRLAFRSVPIGRRLREEEEGKGHGNGAGPGRISTLQYTARLCNTCNITSVKKINYAQPSNTLQHTYYTVQHTCNTLLHTSETVQGIR